MRFGPVLGVSFSCSRRAFSIWWICRRDLARKQLVAEFLLPAYSLKDFDRIKREHSQSFGGRFPSSGVKGRRRLAGNDIRVNPYQYKISLRFRHTSADPADITLALGINPSRSWRAGEPRCTPKGRPLEGRWPESYWTARVAEGQWPKTRLVDAISGLLDQLAAHKDFFHQIRLQGGKVELFVGWFFDGQGGDVFSHDLLCRMANLSIDLSLDIYPPDLAWRFEANVAMAMQVVEPHAHGWVTAMDFMNALKTAVGAPDWHGSGPDAFLDSMIYHDDINALKSPYTISIIGVKKAKPEAQNAIRELAGLIDERGASDRGGDLEVTILVED